ncbi:MAG TPA: hypothetical protein VHB77_03285 [Planctomycetaceae bacterium]|nr:hypothetical protein [Planctomycetaceae bacterium]
METRYAFILVLLIISPVALSETASAQAKRPKSAPAKAETKSETKPEKKGSPAGEPLTVYRPDDVRPQHDDAKLAKRGIHRYESKHLLLYTDIDPEIARTLPPLIDQAYAALEDYFGPLPPSRKRTPFQVTAYIIGDKELFEQAGLIPQDLPGFNSGRHRGAECWMYDQELPYYRRHLLIHESTHCFMTIMPDVRIPVWYLEGMAELFGMHTLDAKGNATFRILPQDEEQWARIGLVQGDVAQRKLLTLNDIDHFVPSDYLKDQPYAWSWALCKFLDTHPRYREDFRDLGRHTEGTEFPTTFERLFRAKFADLQEEWLLFAQGLCYGHDIERAAIDFKAGQPLAAGKSHTVEVASDRGWQSSGVAVAKGRRYTITASGRLTLANEPKPWISEPQGVSIRYFQGRPIGRLLGTVRANEGEAGSMVKNIFDIGRGTEFVAPADGTLYLRINDSWNSLADNSGQMEVEVKAAR